MTHPGPLLRRSHDKGIDIHTIFSPVMLLLVEDGTGESSENLSTISEFPRLSPGSDFSSSPFWGEGARRAEEGAVHLGKRGFGQDRRSLARTGGLGRDEMGSSSRTCRSNPPSIPPCQGGCLGSRRARGLFTRWPWGDRMKPKRCGRKRLTANMAALPPPARHPPAKRGNGRQGFCRSSGSRRQVLSCPGK